MQGLCAHTSPQPWRAYLLEKRIHSQFTAAVKSYSRAVGNGINIRAFHGKDLPGNEGRR